MSRMNKVALVTGASRGIGFSISDKLISKGYRVIGICRTLNNEVLENWNSIGGFESDLYSLDVSDYEQCKSFFQQGFFGKNPVDVLINNAGITSDAMFHKMTYEQWVSVIDNNLKSVFNVTQPVYQQMIARKTGRIVNISSVNGQKGQAGQTNYSAAKAGLHGFTMALAQEASRNNITVNTVSPGYTETSMITSIRADIQNTIKDSIPLKRFATPEEISNVVAFLASVEASYITGADIPVNGGLFIS